MFYLHSPIACSLFFMCHYQFLFAICHFFGYSLQARLYAYLFYSFFPVYTAGIELDYCSFLRHRGFWFSCLWVCVVGISGYSQHSSPRPTDQTQSQTRSRQGPLNQGQGHPIMHRLMIKDGVMKSQILFSLKRVSVSTPGRSE